MTKNYEGGIIGRGITEEISLRCNRGGKIREEQSLGRKHEGDICGASWSSVGSVWDGRGSHLSFGSHWSHDQVRSQDLQYLLPKMQRSF